MWIDWWDVQRSHIFGLFRHGGLPGCNLSEQGNKSWKPTGIVHLVHAARDDATTMMFQETQDSLFEQNLHKSTGRAANQAIRESRNRGQQLRTAQEFFNIRNDPHAILLQAKEALYPASHIPNSRLSFKPPPKKKAKKRVQDAKKAKEVRFNKNKKPSEHMMLLEEQIELARELMNKKAKEVQKQKLPSIIKNPKDVEYGIPNKGNRNIPEVKEVEEVRTVQAQQVENISNPEEVEDRIPNEVNIPQVQEARNIQVQKIPQVVQIPQVQQVKRFQRYSIKVNNPPILIFTNSSGIRMCTGCNNNITEEVP